MNKGQRGQVGRVRRMGRAVRLRAAPLLLLSLLAGIPLNAQPRPETSPILKDYEHDAWRARDGAGLPSDQVSALARTPDGYLWLGSDEGLTRFDGAHFSRLEEISGAPTEVGSVGSLLAGRDGGLWIGTHRGVMYRWRDETLSTFGPVGGFGSGIRAIFEASDGSLWVGTAGAGAVRIHHSASDRISTRNGLPTNDVLAIWEAPRGEIWLATRRGVARWQAGHLTRYASGDGLPSDTAFSFATDPAGALWVGAIGGIARWDGRTRFQDFAQPGSASGDPVTALAVEPDGSLWVGTKGGGVSRFRSGRFEPSLAADVLGSDTVRCILRDEERSVWLGTLGGGLHRLKPKVFRTYGESDGLATNIVSSVLEDASGDIWVGSRGNGRGDFGGLARLDIPKGTWTRFDERDGLASNRVGALFQDRTGTLWVGGAGGGLSKREGGRFRKLYGSDGLPGNNGVLAITQDASGAVWYGTGRGALYRMRDGRREQLIAPAETKGDGNRIFALLSGRDGSVWIGTNAGLLRWKDERFESYATAAGSSGSPGHPVLALTEDSTGTLWVGTRGGGLGRLLPDGTIWRATTREGLCGDVIFRILDTPAGDLWLSGSDGVCRVRRAELEDLRHRLVAKVHAIRYGAAAGIPNGTCTGAAQPAGWRSRDGRLWFTTDAGVTVINAQAQVPGPAPTVRIESVIADQRRLDLAHARIQAGTRTLTVRYTSSSLLDPAGLKFRYRLDGFDPDWIDAGNRRTAEYQNLPAGVYRFRVGVSGGNGQWSDSISDLALRVSPHFYRTPYFAALCAAALLAAAWVLHRLRLRQLRHQFNAVLAERARLARDVHDTLAQGLTAILLHVESVSANLSRSPETARHHVDRVRQTARRSLAEARRAVWDLRRGASDHGSFVTSLQEFAAEMQTGSSTHIEVRSRGAVRPLSDEVERELTRLAQEAVANAVHHARAHTIRVAVAYERASIRLTVSDDGRGFEPTLDSSPPGHFGLVGMRERTERIRGRLRLRSRPGHGTVVSVRVPLTTEYRELRRALSFSNETGGSHERPEPVPDSRTAG